MFCRQKENFYPVEILGKRNFHYSAAVLFLFNIAIA